MAPTINPARTNSQEHLTLNHKLRKPVVEKLRRERINSSIEQLKSLLAPEFLKQQPESKLEKADILEMTVCFLRQLQKQKQQQQHPALDTGAVELGYAKCVHVVTNFLSKDELETQSQKRQFNNFSKLQTSFEKNLKEAKFSSVNYTVQTSINKVKSPTTSTPWRPW
ncbi:transcription factor HES-5-like [Gambusia affinis]|uniref:transcription factor HES-5-like n=1 Tax=Gambusia affinis TaxID=33528 RepID=UPI001CDC78C2|nr:transcription factor HES-5-like [Gambusia affinis]